MLTVLFWASVVLVAYVYGGYPLLAFMWGKLAPRRVAKGRGEPTVSIVIAAFNEETWIGRSIRNKLALDYPVDKIEIIVVSDGSTDRTDDIVRACGRRVRFFRQAIRAGKTAALNLAVSKARGDVIVFADANSFFDRRTVRELVANLDDPAVGYVTGRMEYITRHGSMAGEGCGAYMRYENWLRGVESRIGSIVGVDGGVDAMRRALFKRMRADQLPDLVLPLEAVQAGYRVVYEPAAVVREEALGPVSDEYRMRVRVSLRALWTLVEYRRLLNPIAFPQFALQLASHKVLRYGAPLLFMACFGSSLLLWETGVVYQVAGTLQGLSGAAAVVGLVSERLGRPLSTLSMLSYFLLVNVAALAALVKLCRGERYTMWRPRLG